MCKIKLTITLHNLTILLHTCTHLTNIEKAHLHNLHERKNLTNKKTNKPTKKDDENVSYLPVIGTI